MDERLEVICGCMFSGKTSALIEHVRDLQAAGRRVLCLKPSIDDRYSPTDIVSHDGARLQAGTVRDAGDILLRVEEQPADVVAVDEIHFFGNRLVGVIDALLERGLHVVCSGLDRDMWGDAFAHVEVLCRRGRPRQMLGVCRRCGQPADRTQRTVPLAGGDLVGGSEAFEPRCGACFKPPPEPKTVIKAPGIAWISDPVQHGRAHER